jgi:curved DNA-binding protein
MKYQDYYQTLGVPRDASQDKIKQAFRQAARQHHPDVNPDDPEAEERFKQINEAYQVLSDPEKREKYDRFGKQWKQHQQAGGQPQDFNWSRWSAGRAGSQGGPTRRQVSQEEFEEMFGGAGGFSDFFETLFGSAASQRSGAGFRRRETYNPFTGRSGASERLNLDLETQVSISLREAFSGTSRVIEKSSGKKVKAKIPPGVHTGARVRLQGQGQQVPGNGRAGDLYLNIEVVSDPKFERKGDDLYKIQLVDLYTLVLGGNIEVNTLEKTVRLDIPPGTQNNTQFRLRGQGMPQLHQEDQRGDLFVRVRADLPESLTAEEREHFQTLRDLRRGSREQR